MAQIFDNQFRIGEHVSGYHFADRESEFASTRVAMLSASPFLVYCPRRMGKSSMIHNAAESARTARPKPIIVSVDVATATNLDDVSAQQQDVLRVVALGVEQLYSAGVRDQYALPSASSVHKAVGALTARGLLVKGGDQAVGFDSPFFRSWVRTEVAPDLALPDALR